MEFNITESQRDLFDEVARLARDGTTTPDLGANISLRERWNVIRTTGLAGLTAPQRFGGRGTTGAMDLALAMQALGYACNNTPMVLALNCHLFGGVLSLSCRGMPEQQAMWLPRLTSGEWYACRTLSDVMEAEPVDNGFRLTGVAGVASAGLRPDLAVVFARKPESSDTSSHVFLVPLSETDGIWWEPSQGSTLARADTLRLHRVTVSNNMVLGHDTGRDVLLTELLPREQLALQAARLGLLQRLLETALESARKYARGLKLKGVPPQRYQMLGHKLADFKVRFDAAELMLRRAAWQQDRRDAKADMALAGLAIDSSLLPAAFEVVRLQRDYVLDENQAWTGLLSDVVEYGRYLYNPAQMRATVNETLRTGTA